MAIKVCDTIMGGGKTSAAINFINSSGKKIIFATPYLDQVERILTACPSMQAPQADGKGIKLGSFCGLVYEGKNIVTTHALLLRVPQNVLDFIRGQGYILILDEVLSVLDTPKNSRSLGIKDAIERGWFNKDEETGVLSVTEAFPDNPSLKALHDIVAGRYTFYAGEDVLFWSIDPNVFYAFEEIIILTYMFDCQMQKIFFDMNDIGFSYIGVEKRGGGYFFTEKAVSGRIEGLKEKVHIITATKINAVGDKRTDLSSGWFDKNGENSKTAGVAKLKKNLNNFFRRIVNAKSSEIIWSTFSSHRKALEGKGYVSGFVPFNARATNDYRNRTALAYCVNIFMNPFVKRYFTSKGIKVDEDGLALSDMVQWIWRSAIRDGKEIWIYVPSARMRNLLIEWLERVS